MDNTSPSPPKRPRTIDFLTSQLGRPVRYFPFNKKPPKIIHEEKLGRVEGIQTSKSQSVVSSSLPVIPFSSKMKFVPNKEVNISHKLQKLKLKSPDGRDLGEINVQLLQQKGNGIGGKTIMLQKHSLFSKIDSTSAVSILKPIEKSKQLAIKRPISTVQTTGAQSNSVNNESKLVSVNAIRKLNTIRESGNNRTLLNIKPKGERQHLPRILRHSDTHKRSAPTSSGSKVFLINVDKHTGLNTVKTMNNNPRNSNQKIIVVHAETYPDSTEVKKSNCLGIGNELHIPSSSKEDNNGTELASSTSNTRSTPNLFWNPTKFSEISTKLNNQRSRIIENDIVRIGGNLTSDKSMTLVPESANTEHIKIANKSSSPGNNALQRKINPKLNSWTIVKTSSGKKIAHNRKSSYPSDGQVSSNNRPDKPRMNKIVHNLNTENTQNGTSTTNNITLSMDGKQCDENVVTNRQHGNSEGTTNKDQNLRENIMVIVHGDVNTLKEGTELNQSNNKPISMADDDSPIFITNVVTLDKNASQVNKKISYPTQSNKSSKQDISSTPDSECQNQQDFDIIQKALSSCKDQDLRNKALKALADCGIGVKRDVPVPAKMTVSDTSTQTEVFCLLEPEILVEYNDTSPILNRFNVIERNDKLLRYPYDSSSFNDLHGNYYDSHNVPSPDDTLTMLDDLLADHLLSDDSKKGIDQVKEIFTKADPIVEQAHSQLQRDFQAATNIDTNGMMGIHRAVLSGNIHEVKRQLIVLKAVKKSIEEPTGDGKTSLELAVLYDVDPRIVQALLAAGAKPAVPIKLHESALIIAAKDSSSLLLELIKHVTPASLLDMLDSEGFAPIHYCAQLGNMEGLKALVAAGASINLRDSKSGRTALFHALETRNIEMAMYLIENRASPTIVNYAGQSPAALVDEYRHHSLMEKFNQTIR